MKKSLLILLSVLLSQVGFGQYYYVPFMVEGHNPGSLNTEAENPAVNLSGWTSLWSGNGSAAVSYTANQTIPFAFSFNGTPVTSYKASNAGIVTFDVASALKPAAFGTAALPNANVPDMSVCVLGIKPSSWTSGSSTFQSAIITKTFGTAPHRQHWIQFNFFSEANIQKGWTYWSVVLEEGTNKIYIVDMKTLCVTSAGQLCNSNVKMSAGIQVDNANAYSIANSPNLGAGAITANLFDASDNSYYEFRQGVQPAKDLSTYALTTPDYLALTQLPFAIKGTVMNQGTAAISSFDLYYSINGGTPEKATINASIPKYGKYNFTHTVTWSPSSPGKYTIAVFPGSIDGAADGDSLNDTLSKTVEVVEDYVPRVSLHEVFTASTCPPCNPANAFLDGTVFPDRTGKATIIKYQYSFPGTGDPYYTTECGARGTFYGGINSVPRMQVDGGWNQQPINYSVNLLDQFQAKPSFIKINATHTINFKTVKVDVSLDPLSNFSDANMKVYVAVLEKKTALNVKSNGETEFHHVMKKMLPDVNGTAVGNLTKGTEKTFATFTYQLPGYYRLPSSAVTNTGAYNGINVNTENTVEEMQDLEVVVFVQNSATKEVYQSTWSVGTLLGIDKATVKEESVIIYPNPGSGATTVGFNLEQSAVMSVNVYNMMGQLVETLASREFSSGTNSINFNTENYAKGVYTLKFEGGGFVSSQKFIVE